MFRQSPRRVTFWLTFHLRAPFSSVLIFLPQQSLPQRGFHRLDCAIGLARQHQFGTVTTSGCVNPINAEMVRARKVFLSTRMSDESGFRVVEKKLPQHDQQVRRSLHRSEVEPTA